MGGILCLLLNSERVLTPISRHNLAPYWGVGIIWSLHSYTFTICKVHGWRTFPKCGAGLSYPLIQGPLFWECPHPRGFTVQEKNTKKILIVTWEWSVTGLQVSTMPRNSFLAKIGAVISDGISHRKRKDYLHIWRQEIKQIVHLDEGRKAATKQLWSGKVMTFSLFEERSHL